MTEVTISQALRYTSKLKNQISDARSRAAGSLNHKAGEATAFSFTEMLTKTEALSSELAALQGKLASVNASNVVEYKGSPITLSHAVRVLQELKGRIAWLKGLPVLQTESTVTTERTWDDVNDKYINQTSIMICCLPEAKRAELVDALQDEFDSLNGAVELANQVVKLTI
jgi:hypothetical protein